MMLTAFCGCSPSAGSSTAPASSASASVAPAAAPATEKETVYIGVIEDIDTLDPFFRNKPVPNTYSYIMYDRLMYMDRQTGEISCQLADSYEISQDGTVYTFKLKDGIKFHNGDAFNADDVVYSVEHAKASAGWPPR
jgi:ABC-type transport system substrate-binding protein